VAQETTGNKILSRGENLAIARVIVQQISFRLFESDYQLYRGTLHTLSGDEIVSRDLMGIGAYESATNLRISQDTAQE
jgi:hypothetical protein